MPGDSRRWSADDIIKEYPQLGIPHFHRGLVWGEESVSLLLESLYFGTPCGEIVLWRPRHPMKEGIPLKTSAVPQYLIIDGQQRIRSVWSALSKEANPADLNRENGVQAEGHEVWCLNLRKVPELREYFQEDDSPLFRLVRDPLHLDPRTKARFKHNLIPLARFIDDQPLEEYFGLLELKKVEREDKPVDVGVVQKGIEGLRPQIKKLCIQRVFSVTPLVERNKKHTLPDVVAVYNRINSGGMRVEAEEKAFATLVSVEPRTSIWLGDLFKKIHPDKDEKIHPDKDESLDRDPILRRQKERNFGFKLFIRTFVQVCAYHLGRSAGSSSFSFDVVEGAEFQKKLNESKQSSAVFRQTERILLYVRERLEELHCDDLRTLPETTALLPVFELLIRYPDLMDDDAASPIVRSLILRMLLLPLKDQREVFKLVSLINESQTANRCLVEVVKFRATLMPGNDCDRLLKRIEISQSLQDQYVLMLYWLVRRLKARDFSYGNLPGVRRKLMLDRYGPVYDQEVEIEHSVEPQKQHIVPYSMLRGIYGITERGRLGYHPINNIGNLTYISAALNSYETGLGPDPLKLENESSENLEQHFLAGQDYDHLRLHYQSVIQGENDKERRESYEKFCEARRKLIAQGFADWLSREATNWTLDRRIKPARRLFCSHYDDLIRELKYPVELEDVLLARIDDSRFRFKTKEQKASKKPFLVVSRRDDSKDDVLELKLLKNQIEITAKNSDEEKHLSQLAVTGSLKAISKAQWCLRVGSARSATPANMLSSVLNEVLGVEPQPPSSLI